MAEPLDAVVRFPGGLRARLRWGGSGQADAVFALTEAGGVLQDHGPLGSAEAVGIGADEDFVAGSDEVVYDVPFADIAPPYSIEVALFYQPISPRYAADLFRVDHPEVARFRRFYEAAGNPPELVATDRLVVTE